MPGDPSKLRSVKGCDKLLVELRRRWLVAGTDGDKADIFCQIDRVLDRRTELAILASIEQKTLAGVT